MRAATTFFSILAFFGPASAQAQGHGSGKGGCKRPSRPSAGSGMSVSGTVSAMPSDSSALASPSETTTASSIESVEVSSSSALATGIEASISSSVSGSMASAESSVVITSTEETVTSASSMPGAVLAPTAIPSSITASSSSTSTSASAAASSSSTAPTTDSGDKGVGLGVNGVTGPVSAFTGSGSKMSWYYNWALDSNSDSAGLEFVPMVWGESSVSGIKASAAKWKEQGVTHVLGFNEPDMGNNVGGSNIGAASAATLHQKWVKDLGGQYLIGSPAVARGGKKWMDDWLAACAGNCVHDFVPFHFYGTDVDQLIDYVEEFSAAYNKPLWLTEWACHDYSTGDICDASEVEAFMKTAIDYFRKSGLVERWAWFGAFPDMASNGNANGIMNLDGSINDVGKVYLSL